MWDKSHCRKSIFHVISLRFDIELTSLSIDALVRIAEDLLQRLEPKDYQSILGDVFPSDETWKTSLEPFLGLPPRPSTSITSPLGGTVHLVSNKLSASFWTKLENVPRDSSGESLAFRLTTYVTRLLSLDNVSESLNSEQRETLFHYFPLALQLLEDDMSIEGSIGLVGLQLSEDYDEVLEITSSGRSIVSAWVHSDAHPNDSQSSISEELYSSWNRKIEAVSDVSPESYRIGEAFVKLMSQKESTKTSDELVSISREIRKLNTIRGAAAIAIWGPSLSYSSAGTRLCNELIAEATGFNPQKNREGKYIMTSFQTIAYGTRFQKHCVCQYFDTEYGEYCRLDTNTTSSLSCEEHHSDCSGKPGFHGCQKRGIQTSQIRFTSPQRDLWIALGRFHRNAAYDLEGD